MTRIKYTTGERFIVNLEEASQAGDADSIEANIPRLESLIARLQERAAELTVLQYRARLVREQHEPPHPSNAGGAV